MKIYCKNCKHFYKSKYAENYFECEKEIELPVDLCEWQKDDKKITGIDFTKTEKKRLDFRKENKNNDCGHFIQRTFCNTHSFEIKFTLFMLGFFLLMFLGMIFL